MAEDHIGKRCELALQFAMAESELAALDQKIQDEIRQKAEKAQADAAQQAADLATQQKARTEAFEAQVQASLQAAQPLTAEEQAIHEVNIRATLTAQQAAMDAAAAGKTAAA